MLSRGLLSDWLLAKGPELAALDSFPLLLAGLATEVFPPSFKITFENVCPNASLLQFLFFCFFPRLSSSWDESHYFVRSTQTPGALAEGCGLIPGP